MRHCWVIAFCLGALISHAQTYTTWHIVDSLKKSPVPFALVIDETIKRAIIADEHGYFTLPSSDSAHFFLATSIGYDTTRFRPGKAHGSTILLTVRPVMIDTVAIFSTKSTCLKSLGTIKRKSLFSGSFNFRAGSEIAVFIHNDSQDAGVIRKIRFYIGKTGYPDSKFRAKLYGTDTISGNPAGLLVQEDIILHAEKGNEWVEFDITHLNIQIPAAGFFVAMQWLPDSRRYEIAHKGYSSHGSGQSLGAARANPVCVTWIKNQDSGWLQLSSVINSKTYHNAMIGADVRISCDDPGSRH